MPLNTRNRARNRISVIPSHYSTGTNHIRNPCQFEAHANKPCLIPHCNSSASWRPKAYQPTAGNTFYRTTDTPKSSYPLPSRLPIRDPLASSAPNRNMYTPKPSNHFPETCRRISSNSYSVPTKNNMYNKYNGYRSLSPNPSMENLHYRENLRMHRGFSKTRIPMYQGTIASERPRISRINRPTSAYGPRDKMMNHGNVNWDNIYQTTMTRANSPALATRTLDTSRRYGKTTLHLRGGGSFDNIHEESPPNLNIDSCNRQDMESFILSQSSSQNYSRNNRRSLNNNSFRCPQLSNNNIDDENLTFVTDASTQSDDPFPQSGLNCIFGSGASPRSGNTRRETHYIPTLSSNQYIKCELSPKQLFEMMTKSNTTENFNNIQGSANSSFTQQKVAKDNNNLQESYSYEKIEVSKNGSALRPQRERSFQSVDSCNTLNESSGILENISLISLPRDHSHSMHNRVNNSSPCNKPVNDCKRTPYSSFENLALNFSNEEYLCPQNNQEFQSSPSFGEQNTFRSNLENESFPFMDNSRLSTLGTSVENQVRQELKESFRTMANNVACQSSIPSFRIQNTLESSLANETFPSMPTSTSSTSSQTSRHSFEFQNTMKSTCTNESCPFKGNSRRSKPPHPSFGIDNTLESAIAKESFPYKENNQRSQPSSHSFGIQNTMESNLENESFPCIETSERRQSSVSSLENVLESVIDESYPRLKSSQRSQSSYPSYGFQNIRESILRNQSFPCQEISERSRSTRVSFGLNNTTESTLENESFPCREINDTCESSQRSVGFRNIPELTLENESFPCMKSKERYLRPSSLYETRNTLESTLENRSLSCQRSQSSHPSFELRNTHELSLANESFPCIETNGTYRSLPSFEASGIRQMSNPTIVRQNAMQSSRPSIVSQQSSLKESFPCIETGRSLQISRPLFSLSTTLESNLVNESFPSVESSGRSQYTRPSFGLRNTLESTLANEPFPCVESSGRSQYTRPSFGLRNTLESTLANESFPCVESSGRSQSTRPSFGLQNTLESTLANESFPCVESSGRSQSTRPSFGLQNTLESTLANESFPCVESSGRSQSTRPSFGLRNTLESTLANESFPCVKSSGRNQSTRPSFGLRNTLESTLANESFPCVESSGRSQSTRSSFGLRNTLESTLANESFPCVESSGRSQSIRQSTSPSFGLRNTLESTLANESFPYVESSGRSQSIRQSICPSFGLRNTLESTLANESFPCVESSGRSQSTRPSFGLQNTLESTLANESFPCVESSGRSQSIRQSTSPSFGLRNTLESTLANESFPYVESSGRSQSIHQSICPSFGLRNTLESTLANESFPCVESSGRSQSTRPSFGLQNTLESTLANESFPCVESSGRSQYTRPSFGLQNTLESTLANESFPCVESSGRSQSTRPSFGLQNTLESTLANESFPYVESSGRSQYTRPSFGLRNTLESTLANESFPYLEMSNAGQSSHPPFELRNTLGSNIENESFPFLETINTSKSFRPSFGLRTSTIKSALDHTSFPLMQNREIPTPSHSFQIENTNESILNKSRSCQPSFPSFGMQNIHDSSLANESFPYIEEHSRSPSFAPSFGIQNTRESTLENESFPFMENNQEYRHLDTSSNSKAIENFYPQSQVGYDENYILEDPYPEVLCECHIVSTETIEPAFGFTENNSRKLNFNPNSHPSTYDFLSSTPSGSHMSINKNIVPRQLAFDESSSNENNITPPCSEITVETESLLSDMTNKPIGIKKTRNSFVRTPKVQYFKSVSILEPIPEIPNPSEIVIYEYISPPENVEDSCTCMDKQNDASNIESKIITADKNYQTAKKLMDKKHCSDGSNYLKNDDNKLEITPINEVKKEQNFDDNNFDVHNENYDFDELLLDLQDFDQNSMPFDSPAIPPRFNTTFYPVLTSVNEHRKHLLPNLPSFSYIDLDRESNLSLPCMYDNSSTSFSDIDDCPPPEYLHVDDMDDYNNLFTPKYVKPGYPRLTGLMNKIPVSPILSPARTPRQFESFDDVLPNNSSFDTNNIHNCKPKEHPRFADTPGRMHNSTNSDSTPRIPSADYKNKYIRKIFDVTTDSNTKHNEPKKFFVQNNAQFDNLCPISQIYVVEL